MKLFVCSSHFLASKYIGTSDLTRKISIILQVPNDFADP
jgi:hypothetical protein